MVVYQKYGVCIKYMYIALMHTYFFRLFSLAIYMYVVICFSVFVFKVLASRARSLFIRIVLGQHKQ